MIKLIKIKKNNLKWWFVKIIVFFTINKKKYNFYYKLKKKYLWEWDITFVDFILPIFFNIAYHIKRDIDLNWHMISKQLLKNISKINLLYNKWYNKDYILKIINWNISEIENNITEWTNSALFFSLWVDSFYTLYKNNIKDLIFVHWFDIKNNDKKLYKLVSDKVNSLAQKNNYNVIIIETNLRNFTEYFRSRNYIFGSWLASIWLLINKYNSYYISSWMEDDIWYPWWSHIDLDYLWWNWNKNFIHYWTWITRTQKVYFISKYLDVYDYLRVCWKNYNNKYNCWKCEKCVRTMLDFSIIGKLNKFNVLPKQLDKSLLANIEINDANYLYYSNMIKSLENWSYVFKIIKDKINMFNKWLNKWVRTKNILFIDFNGVISYKNFWDSFEKEDKATYEDINKLLFKENISIVKDWMLWKYTSENVCKYISDKLNLNYWYIYDTLVDDCKKIDLSQKIFDLLKKIKDYYVVILVTDNMDCFSRFTVPYNNKYFNIFDWIFNSSEHWFYKGDIYQSYIKQYNSQIDLSYLIDDSERNCGKFEKLWWNVFNLKWEDMVVKWLKKILLNTKHKWDWQI